ncbi:hypothetical protein [Salinibacter altiplanensis]|uniref:hypothetical protein n=1 Tax=Salinibacter altiplanensis TaxID=1803181 RepID=UPI0013000E27|nr:hypothetical protein [Salinibacter altiplanensis]
MGLSPRAADRTGLREWFAWRRGHQRQERAEWRRALAIVNTVIGFAGGDPVDLSELEAGAGRRRSSQQEYEALLGRNADWIP